MRNRKASSKVGACLIISSLIGLSACGTNTAQTPAHAQAAAAIKIGVIEPLTGPNAALGAYSLDGIKIAASLVNSQGGIDGRQIDLVVANAPTVEAASIQAKQLVQADGIHVVLGTYNSTLAIEAATATTRFGGFYFEVASASSDITAKSAPYSLKEPWTIPDLVQLIPTLLKNDLAKSAGTSSGNLRVALLNENGAYGSGVYALLPAALQAAGLPPLVQEDAYDAATIQDFTPIISRLKAANVSVLLAAAYTSDTVLFIKQASQEGLNIHVIVGLTAGYSETTLPSQLPAPDLNGIYVIDSNPLLVTGLNAQGLKLRQEFMTGVSKYYSGLPISHSAYAFDGAYVVFHYLLPGENISDRAALLKKGMSLNVPLGSLPLGFGVKFGALSSTTHPHINTQTVITLNQWQNGKLAVVGPGLYRNASPIKWLPGG